jgi:hypothetical protein
VIAAATPSALEAKRISVAACESEAGESVLSYESLVGALPPDGVTPVRCQRRKYACVRKTAAAE